MAPAERGGTARKATTAHAETPSQPHGKIYFGIYGQLHKEVAAHASVNMKAHMKRRDTVIARLKTDG